MNVDARTWSATIRMSRSPAPVPASADRTAATIGANRSVSYAESRPCSTMAMRSRPEPVSTLANRSGSRVPPGSRLNSMNTPAFQISMYRPLLSNSPPGRYAAPCCGAGVVEDLGARPARPGITGGPEVVLRAQVHDVVPGHPDLLPRRGRRVVRVDAELLVSREHGHVQVRDAEPEPLREQLEGELHRAVLEVVADRPAAQHLEEGHVVPVADVPDVHRAHARLHVAQVRRGGQRLAQEVRLERGHARVDEQQRRVVGRDDRGGLDPRVLPFGEESQKGLADLVAAAPGAPCASMRPAPGARATGFLWLPEGLNHEVGELGRRVLVTAKDQRAGPETPARAATQRSTWRWRNVRAAASARCSGRVFVSAVAPLYWWRYGPAGRRGHEFVVRVG